MSAPPAASSPVMQGDTSPNITVIIDSQQQEFDNKTEKLNTKIDELEEQVNLALIST